MELKARSLVAVKRERERESLYSTWNLSNCKNILVNSTRLNKISLALIWEKIEGNKRLSKHMTSMCT